MNERDAQVSAVLRRAAELVGEPRGWCQKAQARDADGLPVGSSLAREAVSWCVTGAVYRASAEVAGGIDIALHDAAMVHLGKMLRLNREQIALQWNDAPERTQGEVVAALERAGGVK